jgi:adenylate cyclase
VLPDGHLGLEVVDEAAAGLEGLLPVLGRGASQMGTSTTTGDGGMTEEERAASKLLVYQCLPSRYGFDPDHLRRADAVEVVVGQGAKPGGGGMLLGQKISERVAEMRTLPAGIDQRSACRHTDWPGPDDLRIKIEELREATRQGRLALLPLEMVLAGEGPRRRQADVAEETGLDLDFLTEARRALGLPAVDPDDPVLTEEEVELARSAATLLEAGIDRQGFLELTRTMSQAMAGVAAVLTSTLGSALLRPGDTERDLGLRYAETLRELGPLAGPTLTQMLNLRLREQVRHAVVGQAELQSGRLPDAQHVVVGFVDIVGFTRLGEQVPPDELGAVVTGFEELVEDAVRPPVRLVKTIGDAAMLVAPDAPPVLDTMLGLVESSREAAARPHLRAGIASGEALPRAGDLYGRPVNLASRLTSFARRGTVVTSKEVHDAAEDGYDWSRVGSRRIKGVRGDVEVYRVRPGENPRR